MRSIGSETIFVSDVVDTVSNAIWTDILETSTDSYSFGFWSGIGQLSFFVGGYSVAGFVPLKVRSYKSVSHTIHTYSYL